MFGPLKYRFRLELSKEQLLTVYRGSVQRVRVRTFEGLVLDLDANHLKDFTTHDGIHGVFELSVNRRDHKFIGLKQIE